MPLVIEEWGGIEARMLLNQKIKSEESMGK
jgi:hypothetical protein